MIAYAVSWRQLCSSASYLPVVGGSIPKSTRSHPSSHGITSEAGEIRYVHFGRVNSPDDRLGFCADDITIIPVPEPCSLLALAAALTPLILRRRR